MSKTVKLHLIAKWTGLYQKQILELMEEGNFPKPVGKHDNVDTWDRTEVNTWIEVNRGILYTCPFYPTVAPEFDREL